MAATARWCCDHAVERDVLRRLGEGEDLPGVLVRDEALGDDHEQVRGGHEGEHEDPQREARMPHGDLERPLVHAEHAVEDALGGRVEAPVRSAPAAQEAAAHHGRQRERDEAGHEHRGADDDRELVQQPADHAAHEEHGHEHGGQGQGHRDDGEADLAGAVQRRLHAPLAHLHVADDVLEHHDGVVHDEAHGERQRHQREVVDRVAQHVHDHERADDGHGQRQARDDRRRDVPQEEEDDEDDEGDGEEQGELHVVHRVADRDRAVVEDVEVHRGGELGLEHGEDLPDRVHHLDGVGAGLALDGEDDRPVVVVPARDLVVLHAVDDAPELLEADRRAVAVGDDERPVGRGIGELARWPGR